MAATEWSGRRDSNPRHPAWKASALPTDFPDRRSRQRTTEAGALCTLEVARPVRWNGCKTEILAAPGEGGDGC